MIDQPLTQWTCDVCGEQITSIEAGYVVWRLENHLYTDFKVIHQGRCDPESKRGYVDSLALEDFLGARGLTMLLSWIGAGPHREGSMEKPLVKDLDEFVDLVRRFHIPYYEQARHLFSLDPVEERFSDSNEYAPYLPDSLKRVIEDFSS